MISVLCFSYTSVSQNAFINSHNQIRGAQLQVLGGVSLAASGGICPISVPKQALYFASY